VKLCKFETTEAIVTWKRVREKLLHNMFLHARESLIESERERERGERERERKKERREREGREREERERGERGERERGEREGRERDEDSKLKEQYIVINRYIPMYVVSVR
jgi:hypothetical protein